MSYRLVENLQKKAIPVSRACGLFEVSRSGFYAAIKRRRTAPMVCAASVRLRAAFATSGRTYGSRRLRAALHMSSVTMGRHRVRSLTQANGLRSVWRRKFVHTTDSRHSPFRYTQLPAKSLSRKVEGNRWAGQALNLRR